MCEDRLCCGRRRVSSSESSPLSSLYTSMIAQRQVSLVSYTYLILSLRSRISNQQNTLVNYPDHPPLIHQVPETNQNISPAPPIAIMPCLTPTFP